MRESSAGVVSPAGQAENRELEEVLALPESQSLSIGIAERLREAILAGYFGPGERLREEALARQMGVSRGPIRAALARLEREGLVVIRHNRGAFVGQLSREDLEEVHTLRVVLERLAVERCTQLADEAHFAEMQAVIDEMIRLSDRGITEKEAAELDVRFHDLIYRGSAHKRLQECWANLRPQVHIVFLNRNVAHEDFRDYLVRSHRTILDAMRERDVPKALEILDDHMHGSYERVVLSHAKRLTHEHATSSPAGSERVSGRRDG